MLGDLATGGTLGAAEHATSVALLSGSLPAARRREALAGAASGETGIVVGTHALLGTDVEFADLGLVVVDEQHRFGVEQRAALGAKATSRPHVLVMTATPIPRSVAMTVFGDLETSTLREVPAGRADVSTVVVDTRRQPGWVDRAWQRIREEVAAGLLQFAKDEKLTGAHFTAIGAFRDVTLGYFQMDRKEYKRIPLNEQVEVLSLIGNIAESGHLLGCTSCLQMFQAEALQ